VSGLGITARALSNEGKIKNRSQQSSSFFVVVVVVVVVGAATALLIQAGKPLPLQKRYT
jgi:hypothetical protein